MAGVIQVGDIIKFSELAWNIWNYGWASENNAGDTYRAFGAEVQSLHESLKRLDDAVAAAQASLRDHGARESDILGGDRRSLSEIIGDYEATLKECHQLLANNKRYDQTTGAVKNIEWNINIMPQVEHLRGRVQMHNSRIQHVLKPFEIDLIRNIHADLVRRLTGLHKDILGIRRDIHTLIEMYYPKVATALQHHQQQEHHAVEIPDSLSRRLEGMLEHCQGDTLHQPATLQELTDCFLIHFEKSTVQFQTVQLDKAQRPPVSQYLELLKCQFIMDKMKGYSELQNLPRMSHWPGYIDALQEKLSHQCARFETELLAPDISECGDEMLVFRVKPEPVLPKPQVTARPPYDCVLEVPLAVESEASTWRMMRLLRKCGTHDQFRIIDACGHNDLQPASNPKVVDLNIRTAVLIPIYADPVDSTGMFPPLEIILEQNESLHRYVFQHKDDLLSFQEVLTGYKVAAGYTEPHAVAVFVRQGQTKLIEENVTAQVWIPSPYNGPSNNDSEHSYEPYRSASRISTISDPDNSSSSNSNLSNQSIAAASSTSRRSSGPDDGRPVRIGGRAASTDYGMIRSCPRNPLLVLFTRDPISSQRSMVSIKLDDGTGPNPERCNCQTFRDCRITALEQRRKGFSSLPAKRLENHAKWNLLRLPWAPDWWGLHRVSILFPTVEARYKFSGGHCDCRKVTEGDVSECVSKQHQGLLGLVKVYHRRQMILWQDQRDKLVEVDSTGWPGWVGP